MIPGEAATSLTTGQCRVVGGSSADKTSDRPVNLIFTDTDTREAPAIHPQPIRSPTRSTVLESMSSRSGQLDNPNRVSPGLQPGAHVNRLPCIEAYHRIVAEGSDVHCYVIGRQCQAGPR